MSGRKSQYSVKESPYVEDLVRIMQAGAGPYTRKMLAIELAKLHPHLSWYAVLNEVSYAIQQDRWLKKGRVKVADGRKGWYELS